MLGACPRRSPQQGCRLGCSGRHDGHAPLSPLSSKPAGFAAGGFCFRCAISPARAGARHQAARIETTSCPNDDGWGLRWCSKGALHSLCRKKPAPGAGNTRSASRWSNQASFAYLLARWPSARSISSSIAIFEFNMSRNGDPAALDKQLKRAPPPVNGRRVSLTRDRF
jgi:hypothetical protein